MTRTVEPTTPTPGPDGPQQVSRFEFNLVRLLRFFLGHFPSDQGIQLARAGNARPPCLSPAALELVKDTLAKGCVLFLVRCGGWRNDRYLRGGAPTDGRVWERSPLDDRALTFSAHVVDFLLWATAEKVHETKVKWDVSADMTPADELFFWLAYDACRADPDLVAVLRRFAPFRNNALCWLSFPGDLVETDDPTPPDFRPWLTGGTRAVILECLQTHLTGRWSRSERAKGQLGDWKRMRQQGRAEFAALRSFLEAAGQANRPDLARFVLHTNAALFQSELAPPFWTGGLQGNGPPRLADRLDTQRAALAVPRQMEVLASWQERAQSVGYFDDEYSSSQMWKQDWEAVGGDILAARAREAVEMLEPLRTPNRPPPPGG